MRNEDKLENQNMEIVDDLKKLYKKSYNLIKMYDSFKNNISNQTEYELECNRFFMYYSEVKVLISDFQLYFDEVDNIKKSFDLILTDYSEIIELEFISGEDANKHYLRNYGNLIVRLKILVINKMVSVLRIEIRRRLNFDIDKNNTSRE